MRKQNPQGRRRKKSLQATERQAQPVNGKMLRTTVTWIVNEKSFQTLKFHRYTTWLVCDLIILPVLWTRMQNLMELHDGEHWRVAGWLPLAVDGSRVIAPRTPKNEKAFYIVAKVPVPSIA